MRGTSEPPKGNPRPFRAERRSVIVVDRVNEDVKRIVAESAFEASLEFQEPLEYIVMELEEYKARGIDNPFIYEVEHYGKVLYYNPETEKGIIKE